MPMPIHLGHALSRAISSLILSVRFRAPGREVVCNRADDRSWHRDRGDRKHKEALTPTELVDAVRQEHLADFNGF